MGMIGAKAAQGLSSFDPSTLSTRDKWAIFGAALHDAGSGLAGKDGTALINEQSLLAGRAEKAKHDAFMQQLTGMLGPQTTPGQVTGSAPDVSVARTPGLFGGQAAANMNDASGALPAEAPPSAAPQVGGGQPFAYRAGTTTPGLTIDDPRMAPLTLMAQKAGIPIKDLLEVMKAQQPHMMSAQDGTLINDKSGRFEGMQFPKLDNGIVSQRDPTTGALLGASALPGYAGAAASIAGATQAAQEAEKAKLDLVEVPRADGSTVKVPRDIAVRLLGGGAGSPGPLSGAPGVSGAPSGAAGFGVTQTPAAAELAKARAGNQGKNESDISGARSAMQQVDDQTNMIAQNLHDMVGETQDPNTGKWVKTKPSMVTGLSSGSATDMIEHVPFLNQQAKDLGAKIETVRNGTSFNSMQAIKSALAASGDGGAGSIRMTDQTARMLGEINGSLNQNQSGPQFEATVRRHIDQLDALSKARHDLFESQYQGIRPTTPGQTGPSANYNKPSSALSTFSTADRLAEARRRGLIK